jgi:DNA-binding NarL/FixJ family response regulator
MAFPVEAFEPAVDDAATVTVGIVHDDMVLRGRFRRALERETAVDVVEDAAFRAMELVLRHRPRVLVLALDQPGVERLIEEVRRSAPGTSVVMLAGAVSADALPDLVAAVGTRSGHAPTGSRDRLAALTGREREVLRLLARGHGNAAIGRLLFISESAVKTHVSHILAKLRCGNRVEAALMAYRAGVLGEREGGGH